MHPSVWCEIFAACVLGLGLGLGLGLSWAWAWVGLVTAMSSDDLTGADCVIVRWNRERFESEEELCHQLEVISESR